VTRLARGRKTHLSRDEIAAEALRQFDQDQEPSIRGLATALGVAPSAIYHHFAARSAIVDAALGLVWQEAGEEGLRMVEGKADDPAEVLIAAAVATRRAFRHHHQIAPYIATTPEANEHLSANLGLLAGALEGLGLSGDEAGRAFHAYGSFAIGSTLVLASRLNAGETPPPGEARGDVAAKHDDATHAALIAVVDLSYADPKRDEELFVDGLRRLIASFVAS
jgi:AcrR family transcriptional regulator